jgi:ubiquinone/menaquinone biosynthesis C-methylase UbiE
LLREVLAPGSRVLEAGCGRKTRLIEYADRIDRLVGIDTDAEAGHRNWALDQFIEADLGRRLPFDDQQFDLVYSNFVVEHLADPTATFREFHRVLLGSGHLVVLTSNVANPIMGAAKAMPQWLRVLLKRAGAGAEARNVCPAFYRANTPAALDAATRLAHFTPRSVNYVATLHRYGVGIPGAAPTLRIVERALPRSKWSTIVAAYSPN